MVCIVRVLGLAVFFGMAVASEYSSSYPYEVSVSPRSRRTYASTSWKPSQTGKPKSPKMGQKDSEGGKKSMDEVKGQKNDGGGMKKSKDDDKKASVMSSGSGYSNWNGAYNDCVQQCNAKYGQLPSATADKPPIKTSYNGGATHTVIVAPTQGVLRYVPFAVNASVGDTVKFMWGANNHTVTKSSALLPCNKSSDTPFTSGTQNKDFVFDLVVNDTQPIYFFCGTPTHCQKGMFAMINPPSNANVPTSMSNMMPSIMANDSGVAMYSDYASSQMNGSTLAANWGNNIDLAQLPGWSHKYVAENVLFIRGFIGSNMETVKNDGSIDLSSAGTTPLVIPKDAAAVFASPSSSTTPSTTTPSLIGMSSPGMYQTKSDTALNSMATRASSLSTSGGYVSSVSKVLILGLLAFIVFVA